MRRRRFGPHATVSAVGFGSMSFGGFYGPADDGESLRPVGFAAGERYADAQWAGIEKY